MQVAVPEPGQLVEVRRRQWIVSDTDGSTLTDDGVTQNLLTLASLDEDSPDETLCVVWELEPGARILETAGLPTIEGWDPPEHLETFLDAIRWGATTQADRSLLQAPFRSGVDIEDYQLDPLVRAIDMARANLLIADDVGLGKTIEAGLVIQELLIRHRARTIFIVCPASLQFKWQTEMAEKFGLEFRIVDTDYIRELRRERGINANPWTSFPRLIASMDWMKSGEALRLIKDALPAIVTYPRKFDILVVDEAHNVAPSAASRYAMPSQRTRLIRTLAPQFEHKLFLSATPHNGYTESFTALLELLDDQRFARAILPDEKQLHAVMVRRLKTSLVDQTGEPLYPKRELEALSVEYTDEELKIHELLNAYTSSRLGSASNGIKLGTEFIHKLLKKRLFSSPMAFATTLAKHRQSMANQTTNRSRLIDERILHKAIMKCEEDYANDVQLEESQAAAISAAGSVSVPLSAEQRALLDQLTSWAETAKNRGDSKSRAIIKWLDDHLKCDGVVNDKRVILFTEYLATHAWLIQILAAAGWGSDRLMSLHGGTDPADRERIKAAFQANPAVSPVRILLATDAASEGIDLQNHCNFLIHIEIPWNPNVLEQRNGRIDRHGQKEKRVYIWHPVGHCAGKGDIAGDDEFLMRAVTKVDAIREDLGCVGPVIAQQIEEAMLGRRSELDTRAAEAKAAKARTFLVLERKLQERIGKLHQKLLEARNAYELTPDRICRAVQVAMQLLGKPPLEPAAENAVWKVPLLAGSWNQATQGLAHPHTGVRRPITFDHSVAQGRDDVVLVHLQHKLVQMSLRLLRAEVWAHADRKKLRRVAVRALPTGTIDSPVVVIWSRLLITGGLHHRLHEELTIAGGELKEGSFSRIRTLSRLEELLQSSYPVEPDRSLFEKLRARFNEYQSPILGAVEARSTDRLEFLTNTLNRRRLQEQEDLNVVLDELTRMIEGELADDDAPVQLALWPTEQREQLQKDLEALRARLQRIPAERQSELSSIQRRYESPTARTFPVAVEFLVPAEDIAGIVKS